jgi:hypothetical protein
VRRRVEHRQALVRCRSAAPPERQPPPDV